MRDGGDVLALGQNIKHAMAKITADLPLGIAPKLVADQVTVRSEIAEFMTYAFAMLVGTLVAIAGFVPVGFAASSAGECTFSLFATVGIALIVSWLVAAIFAPLLGVAILNRPRTAATTEPGRVLRAYRGFLGAAIRARWLTILLTVGMFAAPLVARIEAEGGRARAFGPDARREEQMVTLVETIEREESAIEVAAFSIGGNVRLPIRETTARVYFKVWEMCAFAGFLMGREVAKVMLPRGRGTILFTGATASVRGGAGYAALPAASARCAPCRRAWRASSDRSGST